MVEGQSEAILRHLPQEPDNKISAKRKSQEERVFEKGWDQLLQKESVKPP